MTNYSGQKVETVTTTVTEQPVQPVVQETVTVVEEPAVVAPAPAETVVVTPGSVVVTEEATPQLDAALANVPADKIAALGVTKAQMSAAADGTSWSLSDGSLKITKNSPISYSVQTA
jgi:hypothetical protein